MNYACLFDYLWAYSCIHFDLMQPEQSLLAKNTPSHDSIAWNDDDRFIFG